MLSSTASDRIGGRVHTVQLPLGGILELGAQWIHGEIGNVLHQFAKSRNLLSHQVSVDGGGKYTPTHPHTHTHTCVCVCVCVCAQMCMISYMLVSTVHIYVPT